MNTDLKKLNEHNTAGCLSEKAQKVKYSMMYYIKYRQSHENLLMFVMDV